MPISPAQYSNLWNQYLALLAGNPQPPYQAYLDRENFLEDYLDIFRGLDTRATRGLSGSHPFHAQLSDPLFVAPKITYLLIGEAAPAESSTFFYNLDHKDQTNWLGAPLEAFGCGGSYPTNRNEKIEALFALAMKGFLLLDLYPFALAYSKKSAGKTLRSYIPYIPFWDHLVDRINDPSVQKLVQPECLLAFSGPASTHHQIAVQLHKQVLRGAPHLISLPYKCTLTWGLNMLTDAHGAPVPPTRVQTFLLNWRIPVQGFNLDGRLSITTNFYAPKYKCETWDASYVNGPTTNFVKVAFGLP